MPQSAVVSFDSKEFAWKDMSFSVFGGTIIGIRELTYKKRVEKDLIYAAGDEPYDVSRGNKAYEGQMTLLKGEFDKLHKAAQDAGYDDITDLPGFPIVCSYSNDTRVVTDKILKAEFTELSDGAKQGDKFIEISIPFIFTKLQKGV
jgi:hypothetical protein